MEGAKTVGGPSGGVEGLEEGSGSGSTGVEVGVEALEGGRRSTLVGCGVGGLRAWPLERLRKRRRSRR